MADIKINEKLVVSQTGTAEPVLASNVTGGGGLTDGSGLTSLGTVTSGDISAISAGGANTPNFYVYQSSSQSISHNTWTTIIYGNEGWDTDNLYDTSTGKFTVTSSTLGKYYFFASVGTAAMTSARTSLGMFKNTTAMFYSEIGNGSSYPTVRHSTVINLDTDGDYVLIKFNQKSGGTISTSSEREKNYFGGFKLIE